MATVTVNIEAIEHLIESLKPKDRIKLIKDIQEHLWRNEFNEVTSRMHKRVKEKCISDEEIDRICKEARKERYAKNKSGC